MKITTNGDKSWFLVGLGLGYWDGLGIGLGQVEMTFSSLRIKE